MWLLTYLLHGRQEEGAVRKYQRQEKGRQKPRRKGAKGAPTDADFKRAAKTAKEVMDIRAEVINKLRAAVSEATAGEIHRAVEFPQFARRVE